MHPGLPDVEPFTALPTRTWELLGDKLRQAGFNAEYLEGIWPRTVRPYDACLQWPVLLWHVKRRDDVRAYVYRMFILREPVADHQAVEFCGRSLFDELVQAGVLVRTAEHQVVSVLDLRVYRGLLILCDDLSHR